MVQIIENEDFIQYADFNKDVWLLNRTNCDEIDSRVINISEITESLFPTAEKFPKLLTEILNKYGTLDYEVLTDNKENFVVKSYVCETSKIKIISRER